MPPRYARIPPIEEVPRESEKLVELINERIAEVNRVLAEIEVAESVTRGADGLTSIFESNLSMSGNRITNLQRSIASTDAVTRGELESLGILGEPDGSVMFQAPVVFTEGATSTGPQGGGVGELLTTDMVTALIALALEELVATSNDGDILRVEDPAGINGNEGNPIMARDGKTGKARHLQALDGRLVVESPTIKALLIELIACVKELKE